MRKKWAPEDKITIGARPSIPSSVVKSAGRVLQILELFDEIKREANVVEICNILNFPQSSTSALLRSLVTMGYLYYDRTARTYVPTNRVALLGSWVNDRLFREGTLLRLLDELNRKTGDAVILATRNGLHSQYIRVLQATNLARLHLTQGAMRSLAASGTGYAILSTYSDADVRKIVHRINAEAPTIEDVVKIPQLLRTLVEVREQGYAFTADLVTPGGGVIAMPLPTHDAQQPLAIGVGGITEILKQRREKLVEILRETVAEFLGPEAVASPVDRSTPTRP